MNVTNGVTVVKQIACESNSAVGSFAANDSYTGGTAEYVATPGIFTGGGTIAQYAPGSVYLYQRSGTFSYNLAGLTPSMPHQVRRHFCELHYGPEVQPGPANGSTTCRSTARRCS